MPYYTAGLKVRTICNYYFCMVITSCMFVIILRGFMNRAVHNIHRILIMQKQICIFIRLEWSKKLHAWFQVSVVSTFYSTLGTTMIIDIQRSALWAYLELGKWKYLNSIPLINYKLYGKVISTLILSASKCCLGFRLERKTIR